MLFLSRKEGEVVVLELPNGDFIDVVVTKIRGAKVQLGFNAPSDVDVLREELFIEADT